MKFIFQIEIQCCEKIGISFCFRWCFGTLEINKTEHHNSSSQISTEQPPNAEELNELHKLNELGHMIYYNISNSRDVPIILCIFSSDIENVYKRSGILDSVSKFMKIQNISSKNCFLLCKIYLYPKITEISALLHQCQCNICNFLQHKTSSFSAFYFINWKYQVNL